MGQAAGRAAREDDPMTAHDRDEQAAALGLRPEILRALRKTDPRRWSAYAMLLDPEDRSVRLMTRGELAAWLRANDLAGLADEAASRRVPQGAILALVLDSDGPRFRVLSDPRKERST